MRNGIVLIILFLFVQNCYSQIFYGLKPNVGKGCAFRIDLSGCTYTQLPNPRLTGYCSGCQGSSGAFVYNGGASFAKEGYLIVLFNTQFIKGYFRTIDTVTHCYGLPSIPIIGEFFNQTENWTSLVTDDCNVLWSSSKERLLSVDIPRGYKLTIHGFTAPYQFINLCYRDGALFGMFQNGVYKINTSDPSQSTLQFKFANSLPYQNDSLVSMESVEIDCGVWETYLFSEQVGHPTIPLGISKLDFSTGTITPVCTPDTPYVYSITAWPKPPPCKTIFDLDINNSCGLVGADFQQIYCPDQKRSISDIDAQFHFPRVSVDSIWIELHAGLDQNKEKLSVNPCSNYKLQILHDTSILLTGFLGTDAELASCIQNVFYENKQKCPQEGTRTISFVLKTCDGFVYKANSYIHIPQYACAGLDTSILICSENVPFSLHPLLRQNSWNGGRWSPDSILINMQDSLFYYIEDRGNCNPDTAKLNVHIKNTQSNFLGQDVKLCNTSDYEIKTNINGSHLWNTGSSSSELRVTQSGTYSVQIIDSTNCVYTDTIEILFGKTYVDSVRISSCLGDSIYWRNKWLVASGSYIDSISSSTDCDSIFQLNLKFEPLISKVKTINVCPEKTYVYKGKNYNIGDRIIDTVSALLACDTILSIDIKAHTIKALKITADSLICTGKATSISSNNSYTSYRWSSGEQINSITKPAGTYTLTVTDQNGCMQSSSITIKEALAVDFTVEKTDPLCPEDLGSIRIIKTSGGIDPIRFTINGQSTSSTQIDQLTPGKYIITGIDALGCMTHDTVEIIAAQKWNPSLKNTYTLDAGTSLLINFDTLGIKKVIVNPSDHINPLDDLHIVFSPDQEMIYFLTLIDENGCEYVQEIKLIIQRNDDIHAPNIFTPNGDNLNDEWQAQVGSSINIESLKIYDRWGSLIHSTAGNTASWNGKIKGENAMPGVYVIVLNYKTSRGETKVLIQDVSLIR